MISNINIVGDDEILISEEAWIELNNNYTKDEIKIYISDTIEKFNIPLPFRDITFEDALNDFKELQKYTETPTEGKWFTRYDYDPKYYHKDLYFHNTRTGNKASDYFHQTNRWNCDSINAPSPYRSWHIEKFRLTLFNALWTMKVKRIDKTTMRTIIGLRKYIASQFRPATAKVIYDYFGAKNVLDISSGWGDRLAGFCASSAESYVGIDPNNTLIEGYQQQIETYGQGKSIEMIEGCAEDVKLGDKKFDFIFTSPPYFNIERYTQETNQSFKKYRKLDRWLEDFLFVSLKEAWEHLEDGGTMAINISDVYSNHTINRICDPMNDFIGSLEGAKYDGCYGYRMAKRPNSGALKDKEGVFCEPMWVWKKST